MTFWRHINTAPKGECPEDKDHEGPVILLYSPRRDGGHRITVGQWMQVVTTCAEFAMGSGEYWEGWMSWDGGFTDEDPPTHWMPMPEPPVGYFPPK
jgi:hypothetical protein